MRLKPTFILLLIAAIALGYFFLFEQPRHERERAKTEGERRLTPVVADDVRSVRIRRAEVDLEFSRMDGQWRMIRPEADRAEQGSVNTLVYALLGAEIESRFAAEPDQFSEYGLDEPQATILLADSLEASLLALDIGELTLTKTHCYAKVRDSDSVLLLPAGVRRYAIRDVFEFRDKKVVDFAVDDVVRLAVQSDQQRLLWERSISDQWFTYQAGDTIRGDKVAVETILRELRALRARNFLPDDAANIDRLFARPRGEIVFWLRADSAKVALRFSHADSTDCYVKVNSNPRIEIVDATALDVFDRTLEDLRDRRLLHFDRDELSKVVLEAGDVTVSVFRTGTEWSFANPTFGSIDQAAITTFLNELEALKFREIIEERAQDIQRYGLNTPSYRLMLYDDEGRLIDEAVGGGDRPGPRLLYATSRSSRHLGTTDAEPLEEIKGMFEDFRLQ